jgi:hypothetical protein
LARSAARSLAHEPPARSDGGATGSEAAIPFSSGDRLFAACSRL